MSTTILSPLLHEVKTVDAGGNIVVSVDNPDNNVCFACVFDYDPAASTGLGASHGSVRMTVSSTSARLFQATVNVGTVPAPTAGLTDNKFVQVENQSEGTLDGNSFRAVTSGSGSRTLLLASSMQRCAHCAAGQPVPVALSLQLDTKVAAGACADCGRLNQPTLLAHSNDAKLVCCWLSQPIKIGSDGGKPAMWMLEKTDDSTWTLSLRRGSDAVVTYSLRTKKEKDCSFPIKLKLVGKGGKECKKWPKTVTIKAAP
jgi:hypothetical protein